VELVSTTPALHSAFPPAKRLRTANGHAAFTNGEGSSFSMTGLTNSAMERLNQAVWGYNSFPAGMQGARHDVCSASSFSSYPGDMSHPCMGNSFGNNTFSRLKNSSTELHVTDTVGNHNSSSIKPVSDSFQLFGAIIRKVQPFQNSLTGTGCPSTGDKSLDR